ncbi:hypothetical protein EMN47_05410 [Prolixibacteraceae bacterium JC049]|nr:hypothetical protein [Prolixibacteraceae bacterium JC049]
MRGILFIIMVLVLGACAVQHKSPKLKTIEPQEEQKDSTEYELISFDSEFDSWYALKNSPVLEQSNEYYISWNERYIQAWNYRAMQSGTVSLFAHTLDIQPGKDYGYEVNKQLYFYFRFVETELKIQILDYKRHSFP